MGDSTTAYVIEQAIQPEAVNQVRELVRDSEQRVRLDELSSRNTVQTASLFVRCRGEKRDALVWYLEVESGPGDDFDDPEAIVRESALFDAGLDELLESPETVRTYAEGADNNLLIHESHPARDEVPPGDDVVLIRLNVRAGFGTWVMRLVAGAIWWLDGGRIGQRLQDSSGEVMEEEGMVTETIFIDDGDDGLSLLWYMESDGQERVLDAYYETSNLVARVSEVLLGTVLERPEELLGNPHTYTDHDLLVHATNPDRV